MSIDVFDIFFFLSAGAVAGFINTLAGSGSVLTISLMIFYGLPANVANGSNRIGVLFQSLASFLSFRKHGQRFNINLNILIPSFIGSIIGASIAVDLPDVWMDIVMAVIFFFLLVLLITGKDKWLKDKPEVEKSVSKYKLWIVFLGVGLYGGFIQGGVGILITSALLSIACMDLIKATAMKVFLVFVFNVPALFIFYYNGLVNVEYGILLAAGQVPGGYFAAKMATKMEGAKPIILGLIVIAIIITICKLILPYI